MYLVDDIDFVNAHLRGNSHLVNQASDVVDRIVGSTVKFIDVERSILIKGEAGGTGITCFCKGGEVFTIDGFCQDPSTGCLSYAPGATEEKCLGQLIVQDCVF